MNSPFLRLLAKSKGQKVETKIEWLHKDTSTHIDGWAIVGQTEGGYTILRNIVGDGDIIEMSLN